MKTQLVTFLLLVLSFSVVAEFSSYLVPVVSSVESSRSSSVSATAAGIPRNVEGAANFVTSINITGNIVVSGNDVVRFAGLNPSIRAKVFLNGSIFVEDTGLLDLEYVSLYFVGGKKPYDRNITLSAIGHPRLTVSNATVATYDSVLQRVSLIRRDFRQISYGCAIFAYNNSEISGGEFALYRNSVYSGNVSMGGPATMQCYGNSHVDLSNCAAESLQVFDNAQVSIHTGKGPGRLTVGSRVIDGGLGFSVRGSSNLEMSGVNFANGTVFDSASLTLRSCQEVTRASITTDNFATVSILDGTTISGSLGGINGSITTYIPGIKASGQSRVSLNASLASTGSINQWPIAYLYGSAALFMDNCSFNGGRIATFDSSSAFLSNMRGFASVWFESHGSSSISFVNCRIMNTGSNTAPQIESFDSSRFSFVDSFMQYAWVRFFNGTSAYFSNSTAYSCQIVAYGTSNLNFVAGSSVGIALQLTGYSKLIMDSSSGFIVQGVDESQMLFTGSNVSLASVKDKSELLAYNTVFQELLFSVSNASASLTGVTSFFRNFTFAPSSVGPSMSVFNTSVNDFDLLFLGSSSVSISNSTLRNLSLQGSSFANLTDVSVGSGVLSVMGSSTVYFWSPLHVRVVDYFGNPVSGVQVTLVTGSGISAKALSTSSTDSNGVVDFVLFSEFDNATGSFSTGYAKVRCQYGTAYKEQDTSLSRVNSDITVSMTLPSWTGYIFAVLVIVALFVIVLVISFIYRRIRRKNS